MKNYYKESLKEFIKYIKQNPNVTKEEWDKYAEENKLFSSFTIESHEIEENTIKMLQDKNEDVFAYLKKYLLSL